MYKNDNVNKDERYLYEKGKNYSNTSGRDKREEDTRYYNKTKKTKHDFVEMIERFREKPNVEKTR